MPLNSGRSGGRTGATTRRPWVGEHGRSRIAPTMAAEAQQADGPQSVRLS